MTWDDLTAEEREVVIGVLRASVRASYPGVDARKIEVDAWAELCRRYSTRPGV